MSIRLASCPMLYATRRGRRRRGLTAAIDIISLVRWTFEWRTVRREPRRRATDNTVNILRDAGWPAGRTFNGEKSRIAFLSSKDKHNRMGGSVFFSFFSQSKWAPSRGDALTCHNWHDAHVYLGSCRLSLSHNRINTIPHLECSWYFFNRLVDVDPPTDFDFHPP